jgi:uncharacterized cupin superfamily protein
VEVFNLYGDEWDDEWGPAGFHRRMTRVGARLGAAKLGATLYELPSGERTWPYHYDYGNEEWLVVVSGTPTLRTVEGERELQAGDVVSFLEGPGGAHQVINRAHTAARVLILSTKVVPSVVVYPDSDKIGVSTGNPEDRLIVKRDAAVDYWDGEAAT